MRTEELLTLADAASELPRRRLGRRPDVSTLHRWVTRGLRGVRLEAVQVGGCRCTSREALLRFFEQLGYVPLRTTDLDGFEPINPCERAWPPA